MEKLKLRTVAALLSTSSRFLKFVLTITKGLLREQELRRKTMFLVVLAALAMLFCGATFMADALRANVLVFLLFWAGCVWLTILAVLLAIFDLLIVRAQALAARKQLQREIIEAAQAEAAAAARAAEPKK